MTHTLTTLRDLKARLDAAKGPDRELDAAIFVALVEPTWVTSPKDPGAVAADAMSFRSTGKLHYITKTSKHAPHYTASIDAAVALVERALPGKVVSIIADAINLVSGENWRGVPLGKALPLALCRALLSALIAKEKARG